MLRIPSVCLAPQSGHLFRLCLGPLSANSGHQPSPVQRGRYSLDQTVQFGGPLKSARQRLGMARYSQQLLQLFDLPGGLVVDDIGLAAADRLVK